MEYLAKALVLVFSVTSALVPGSLRTRGLLPNSIHCVGYLVTIAPILSLMVFLFVSALVQIKGDKFLTLGAVCRFLAPLVYVFRSEDYLEKSSDDTEKKIDFNQKIVLSLNLTGLALIVVRYFQNDFLDLNDKEQLRQAVIFILSVWGRTLAFTVVTTDEMVYMTIKNWRWWRTHTGDISDLTYESIEEVFHHDYFDDASANEAPTV